MLFESMLAIGAVLLIGSGGMKLIDRAPTRGALRTAGLPSSDAVVILLAGVEMAVGAGVIVVDHPSAPLVFTAVYLGFAAFVAHALRHRLPIQSCGCFGKTDTPPSTVHLVADLSLAAAGAIVAATPGSLAATLDGASIAGTLGLLVFAGVGAYLMYLLLAEFPATMAAVEGDS